MSARVSKHVVSTSAPGDGCPMAHFVYLHGFASSPQSGKVSFLSERLAARGLTLHCPDLNEPDFSIVWPYRNVNNFSFNAERP